MFILFFILNQKMLAFFVSSQHPHIRRVQVDHDFVVHTATFIRLSDTITQRGKQGAESLDEFRRWIGGDWERENRSRKVECLRIVNAFFNRWFNHIVDELDHGFVCLGRYSSFLLG